MSGIGSLLTGSPTPPQPTSADATSSFPVWLQDYLSNMVSGANSLIDTTPMSVYGDAASGSPSLVATPSANTQAAWQSAVNNQGSWKPALADAGGLTMSAASPISADTMGSNTNAYNTDALGSVGQYGSAMQGQTLGNQSAYSGNTTGNLINSGNQITGALNNAVQSNVGGYLNPYTENVIGGIESSMNTNLMQNVLPQIQDRMVQSGQVASPQQMQAENNAVYQNQQAIGQAIAQPLQSGYTTALGAAQNSANNAFGYGNQGALSSLTTGAGQAGQAVSSAQTGASAGNQMSQAEQAAALQGGSQMGQIASLNSNLNASDVGQLAAAGAAQDSVNQANINATANLYNTSQQMPYQLLGFMSNLIRGQNMPTNVQTTALSYQPQSMYSPSPLSTAVGTTALASGLGLAKGGKVKPRGALSLYAA